MSSSNRPVDSALGSARNCFAVTPHDTASLPSRTKGLYIGSAGTLVVRTSDADADVAFTNVPSGMVLDIDVTHVRATGTTASAIVGMA